MPAAETHAEFYERWSAEAAPYFGWQFEQFRPYVGRRVADIGCGLGSFVDLFLKSGIERYLGVEPDPELRSRFAQRHRDPRAQLATTLDATDERLGAELRAASIDTAFSVNVLEHIERDDLALGNMIAGTASGGHVCLLVPAHPFLFGSLDALDGHYRRYTARSFRDLIQRAGGAQVEVLKLYPFNLVAAFGWFLKGRILREKIAATENYTLMNAILPVVSRLERLRPPPFGLSLVAVLKRR
jgi:SAM-dependent methyltransferase